MVSSSRQGRSAKWDDNVTPTNTTELSGPCAIRSLYANRDILQVELICLLPHNPCSHCDFGTAKAMSPMWWIAGLLVHIFPAGMQNHLVWCKRS
jgi:hypothetical protein